MFKALFILVLTVSVSFLGLQMYGNQSVKNIMREKSKNILARCKQDTWIEHFNCFHSMLFYMIMLAPLVLVAPSMRIAGKFAAIALTIVALLAHFDQNAPLKMDFLQCIVVSFGLLYSGRGCGKGKTRARDSNTTTQSN